MSIPLCSIVDFCRPFYLVLILGCFCHDSMFESRLVVNHVLWMNACMKYEHGKCALSFGVSTQGPFCQALAYER